MSDRSQYLVIEEPVLDHVVGALHAETVEEAVRVVHRLKVPTRVFLDVTDIPIPAVVLLAKQRNRN